MLYLLSYFNMSINVEFNLFLEMVQVALALFIRWKSLSLCLSY